MELGLTIVYGANTEEDVSRVNVHMGGLPHVLSACSIWGGRGGLSYKLSLAYFCKGRIFCFISSLCWENPFIFIGSSVKATHWKNSKNYQGHTLGKKRVWEGSTPSAKHVEPSADRPMGQPELSSRSWNLTEEILDPFLTFNSSECFNAFGSNLKVTKIIKR